MVFRRRLRMPEPGAEDAMRCSRAECLEARFDFFVDVVLVEGVDGWEGIGAEGVVVARLARVRRRGRTGALRFVSGGF